MTKHRNETAQTRTTIPRLKESKTQNFAEATWRRMFPFQLSTKKHRIRALSLQIICGNHVPPFLTVNSNPTTSHRASEHTCRSRGLTSPCHHCSPAAAGDPQGPNPATQSGPQAAWPTSGRAGRSGTATFRGRVAAQCPRVLH